MRYAFLIVLLLPTFCTAKPTEITKKNLGRFKQLSSRELFTCFRDSKGEKILGTLNSRPLRVGKTWVRNDESTLGSKIKKLEKELRKLKSERRKDKRVIASKSKELTTSKNLIPRAQFFATNCGGKFPTNEFVGAPDSLAPYRERLTTTELSHLMNKVAFGGTSALASLVDTQGLSSLADWMTTHSTSQEIHNDALFWAKRQIGHDSETGEPLWYSYPLKLGAMYESLYSDNPFHARMTLLFWHPHFAINLSRTGLGFSRGEDGALIEYWENLRHFALGNFNEFTKKIVVDKAMTRWLNNEDNHADAPNQNFAREFLELFTLGQYDPITHIRNYDERSIVAATGYFSGFYGDFETGTRRITYAPFLHDSTNYTVFPGIPAAEAATAFSANGFVDHVLFNHPNSARFLAERLFAQLVRPDVPEKIVSELASDLITNDYNIAPILKKILRSQAMFSTASKHPCISAPVDKFILLARKLIKTPLDQVTPSGLEKGDGLLWLMTEVTGKSGQSIFEPPSVFAWKGACGLNREGQRHYGEGFVTEQNALNRSKGAVDIINYATDSGLKYLSLLPSTNLSPREVVLNLAKNLFNFVPSESQISQLTFFLTHGPQNGATVDVEFDLSDEYYTQRKLPALISLLADTVEANAQ